MIIKRKLFASNDPTPEQSPEIGLAKQEMTSKDLQIEQMRLQRQILETQRMRQRMQAEERMQEMKQVNQTQKLEQKKDEAQKDNQLKVKKIDAQNSRQEEDINNLKSEVSGMKGTLTDIKSMLSVALEKVNTKK
jgi:hypothetical protein